MLVMSTRFRASYLPIACEDKKKDSREKDSQEKENKN
jgi:hypothetical protein